MLPRLLSRWNVLPRKAAEQAVHDGRVRVDGRVVRDVTRWIDEAAHVEVDGRAVGPRGGGPTWLLLHKPRGVVTTTRDPEGRPTVIDLLGDAVVPGLAPVGRLDLDSQGVLLLSDEHAVAARLLAPETHVTKRYRVKVRGHPDEAVLDALRTTSLTVDDLVLGPMAVAVASRTPAATWLDVTLTEGKNRQIRRRLAAVGHDVETLVRVAFGPIGLGELAPGAWRALTSDEVAAIRDAAR